MYLEALPIHNLEKPIFTGLSGKSRAHLEHQNHLVIMIKLFMIDVNHSTWYVIPLMSSEAPTTHNLEKHIFTGSAGKSKMKFSLDFRSKRRSEMGG